MAFPGGGVVSYELGTPAVHWGLVSAGWVGVEVNRGWVVGSIDAHVWWVYGSGSGYTLNLKPFNTQEYLAHKKQPTSLGPPEGPRHSPTVGSWVGAVSYERGTPITPEPEPQLETFDVLREWWERETSSLTTYRSEIHSITGDDLVDRPRATGVRIPLCM